MIKYNIIINNPNLDNTSQEHYNRLFEYYSKLNYKMNPDKFKLLMSVQWKKEEEKK